MNIADLPNAQAVFIHDDLDGMGLAVAQRVTESAAEAIVARGAFRLVLAGGETPRRCYEKLRGFEIDWARVQVYFGDERCLPRGDTRRNDVMVHDTLLQYIDIPQENIHAIAAELGAREAAARYSAELGNFVQFDLVLLGMGEDGHTASLFPDNAATDNLTAAVPVFNAPKPPAERVSLSLSTLNAARKKIFMVAGEGKRKALEKMLNGAALPAARVTSAEWHLDCAALPG